VNTNFENILQRMNPGLPITRWTLLPLYHDHVPLMQWLNQTL